MNKILSIFMVASILLTGSCFAAGTATFTAEQPRGTTKWKLTWVITSAADGSVSSPTTTGTGYDSAYYGKIYKVIVTPGTTTLQPSDDFDVQIRTNKGGTTDIAQTLLTNCDDTVPKVKGLYDGLIYPLSGEVITPYATGMGDSNSATIEIWIE